MRSPHGPHSGPYDDSVPNSAYPEWYEGGETFRPTKGMVFLQMVLSLLFLAVTISFTIFFFVSDPVKQGYSNADSPFWLGLFGVALFGTIFLVSTLSAIVGISKRLTINGTSVTIRSLLRHRDYDLTQTQALIWKDLSSSGRLLFQFPHNRLRLDLGEYSSHDRLRIITFFRDNLPETLQQNWPEYCRSVALPLRDGQKIIQRIYPAENIYWVTRKRYDRIALVAIPLSIIVAIVAWGWLNLPQLTGAPFLVTGAWLFIRFTVPREGEAHIHVPSSSPGRLQLSTLAFAGSFPLMIALEELGFNSWIIWGIGVPVMLAGYLSLLLQGSRDHKNREAFDEDAAQKAVELWEQPSSA